MSFRNPTKLQLGMEGKLLGKHYRVAGRVVMGMEDEGQTYYWNEFNLLSDEDDSATLVYEETEKGGEWRLFTYFDPQFPITAEDAATRRVGDQLNLDGTDVSVTLVDESRVYYIEGEAPEGVEIGDVARYFNAEAGNVMIVVSWTGDEVECYHGVDVSSLVVTSAFGLPRESGVALPGFVWGLPTEPAAGWRLPKVVVGFGAAIIIIIVGWLVMRPKPAAMKWIATPDSRLRPGVAGILDGRRFGVQSHVVMAIAEVGQTSERHEYELQDAEGSNALLVCGFTPGKSDWVLFRPVAAPQGLTPQAAALVQVGRPVAIDGQSATVRTLFQSSAPTGPVLYGFSAQAGPTPFLVRWKDAQLTTYRGTPLRNENVKSAFGN